MWHPYIYIYTNPSYCLVQLRLFLGQLTVTMTGMPSTQGGLEFVGTWQNYPIFTRKIIQI